MRKKNTSGKSFVSLWEPVCTFGWSESELVLCWYTWGLHFSICFRNRDINGNIVRPLTLMV